MTQEIATKIYIENALKEFNVTDAALAIMREEFGALQIKDIDDKEGFKLVVIARKKVKEVRISIDKKRKELTADALVIQRGINDEAKKITLQLEEIESGLQEKEAWFETEKECIKKEKAKQEQLAYAKKIQQLKDYGYIFDGFKFFSIYDREGYMEFQIKTMSEDLFQTLIESVAKEFQLHEMKRQAEEQEKELLRQAEARKQAEAEAQRQANLAKEREELLAMRKAQEEERKAIEAEKALILEKQAELKRQEVLAAALAQETKASNNPFATSTISGDAADGIGRGEGAGIHFFEDEKDIKPSIIMEKLFGKSLYDVISEDVMLKEKQKGTYLLEGVASITFKTEQARDQFCLQESLYTDKPLYEVAPLIRLASIEACSVLEKQFPGITEKVYFENHDPICNMADSIALTIQSIMIQMGYLS